MKKSILCSIIFLFLRGSMACAMKSEENKKFMTGVVLPLTEDIAQEFAQALEIVGHRNGFADFSPIRDIDDENLKEALFTNLRPVDIPITALAEGAEAADAEVAAPRLWFDKYILPHLSQWYNTMTFMYEDLTQKAIEENCEGKKFLRELETGEKNFEKTFRHFYRAQGVSEQEMKLYLPVRLDQIMYRARQKYSRCVDRKMTKLTEEFQERVFEGELSGNSLMQRKAEINKEFMYYRILLELFDRKNNE